MKPLAACLALMFAANPATAAAGFQSTAPIPVASRSTLAGPAPRTTASVSPLISCADAGNPGTLRSVVASAASGETLDP